MFINLFRVSLWFALFVSGSTLAQQPVGLESSLIERGRYLATAGGCKTCHTEPGGAPFAGGVTFVTDFGVIYSTNITPHEAGLGGWSEEDFVRAMREGVSADGTHLYPVFPYPSFATVTDDDLGAIWAYLATITPDPAPRLENELNFPFNIRGLLGLWKWLYLDAGPFTPSDDKSPAFNRGAYLVEGLAHCGSCHTPRNALGAEDRDLALSGGTYQDEVSSGEFRPWSAVNLTPAPDGLGAWSKGDISQYLKTGHSGAAGTFGPMNKVIMGNTSLLSQSDVDAMATYLSELQPIQRASQHEMDPEDFREGELLYTIHCGTCHLPTGLGDPSIGPMLAGSAVVQAEDPASLINSIIYGAEVPAPAPPHAWESMEAFGDKLDDDEIALLSTYLRSNWGNLGGPVNESDVARQR